MKEDIEKQEQEEKDGQIDAGGPSSNDKKMAALRKTSTKRGREVQGVRKTLRKRK